MHSLSNEIDLHKNITIVYFIFQWLRTFCLQQVKKICYRSWIFINLVNMGTDFVLKWYIDKDKNMLKSEF